MKESALYIHIPFCDHKCIYCDFYSVITEENIKPYLDALKKEIKFYSAKYAENFKYKSVFFGGGTPSLMEPDYISEIMSELKRNFYISEDAEITMETNPGTVDKKKLKEFFNTGINRLSIGIQSFDEKELKFLTRIHNKKTAIETVCNAKEAGFKNINIDLIFNLPGQTKEVWKYNLLTAVNLPITHISAYSLILERGTILNKMVLDGKIEMQDDDYGADLYEITIDFLTDNGFVQYEVSNFAKTGFECVHNNAYWRYKNYLGLGTSSHSFIGNKRWWNFSSLKKYISEIEINKNAVANFELIDKGKMLSEYIMLALRSNGLNIPEFKGLFGEEWLDLKLKYFKDLERNNYLIAGKDNIRLTKSGYAVCDEILSSIL